MRGLLGGLLLAACSAGREGERAGGDGGQHPEASVRIDDDPSDGDLRVRWACNFDSALVQHDVVLRPPTLDATEAVKGILSHVGLPQNFEIYAADIRNAAALQLEGRRLILYDSVLIAGIRGATASNWSAVAVLAHEVGHHLSGHTLTAASSPNDELAADRFAGFVLSGMGATLVESQLAVNLVASEFESATHPARARRLVSTHEGWSQATSQRATGALPPPPPDDVFANPSGGGRYQTVFTHEDFNGAMWSPNRSEDPDSVAARALEAGRAEGGCGVHGPAEVRVYSLDSAAVTDPLTDMAYVLQSSDGRRDRYYVHKGRLSQAARSNFEMAMVPGRRLRVTHTICGSGGFLYLTSVVVLRAQ